MKAEPSVYNLEKYEALLKQQQHADLIPMIHQIIKNIDFLLEHKNKSCQAINELVNYYTFLNFIIQFLNKNDEFFNLRDNIKEIITEIEALRGIEKNLFRYMKGEMAKDLLLIYSQHDKNSDKKNTAFCHTSAFLRILEYIKVPTLNLSIKLFLCDNFHIALRKIKKNEGLDINGIKLINLMNFLNELININKSTNNMGMEGYKRNFEIIESFIDQFSLILFSNKELKNIYEVYIENITPTRHTDEVTINWESHLKNYASYNLGDNLRARYNSFGDVKNYSYKKVQEMFIKEFKSIDICQFKDVSQYLNILVAIENHEITKLYIELEFFNIHENLVLKDKLDNKKESLYQPFQLNNELFKLIDDYFKNPCGQLIFNYLNRDRLLGKTKTNRIAVERRHIEVNANNFQEIFKLLNVICRRLTLKLEFEIIKKELETFYSGLGDVIYLLSNEYKQ
ncbi:hypothetical protein CDIK_0664 [Cucumispora dikerogammari]|nr:hypothetical protein CDIK_0664 [Cucumispora dikerogammari]